MLSTDRPVPPWPALLVLSLALAAGKPALAQGGQTTVYRCGNTYQAEPCAGAVAVDADDRRSAEQLAQARQAARQDAAIARQMTADRQAAERQAARQGGAANVGPTAARAPAKPASKPAKPHPKKKQAVRRVTSPKVTGR